MSSTRATVACVLRTSGCDWSRAVGPRLLHWSLLASLSVALTPASAPGGTVSLGIAAARYDTLTNSVLFDLEAHTENLGAERLVYLGIDAGGSANVTVPVGQFGSWQLTGTGGVLSSWNQLSNFGTSGFESLAEFETATGVADGNFLMGTIVLNATGLGLAPGASGFVSINGLQTTVGLENPSVAGSFRFADPAFTTSSQSFVVPVPEPGHLGLSGIGMAVMFMRLFRPTCARTRKTRPNPALSR